MEARTLKTLLSALTAAGVTSYKDADVTIEFGPTFRAPESDVEGDLLLPEGVPDAAAALAAIRKAYAPKEKRS